MKNLKKGKVSRPIDLSVFSAKQGRHSVFFIRLGVPEMELRWTDLCGKAAAGKLGADEKQLYQKWGKAMALLAADPRHPEPTSRQIFLLVLAQRVCYMIDCQESVTSVRRKYLVGPFICTFACWTLGNGTLPILPLYAMERGASETSSGLFLAFAFLCLALGTVATGFLPKDFRHRKWLIAASGLLMMGLTWLTSYTTTLVQFAGASGLNWFLAGVILSQAATLTGLAADSTERGVAFGILGMTNGLGSLIGGIGVGYVADRFGFTVVFESIAAFCILIVIGGLISVESPGSPAASQGGVRSQRTTIGALLVLLLASQLLLSVTNATGNLGRSLAMNSGGFSKFAITLTASIQGLVGLCFPLFLGWLSDRIGRRWIMIATYFVTSASLVLLAFSRTAWHFYAFAGLYAFLSIPFSVGPAYVMDIVPKERAARGVSLFQSVFWAGNIVGMAACGLAFDKLGTSAPILFSSLFPIAGIILLLLIPQRPR